MTGNRWAMVVAVMIVVVTAALMVVDAVDDAVRRWWAEHAFTTSIVGGLLVLAVTLLVVNQVLNIRDLRSRAQATAAQAAILLNQARRTADAVDVADQGDSERDAASDETRTYMTMVLIGAPVLINASVPRAFLEQAQWLGVLFSRALNPAVGQSNPSEISGAFEKLRAVASPLLRELSHSARRAVGASEAAVGDTPIEPAPPTGDHET